MTGRRVVGGVGSCDDVTVNGAWTRPGNASDDELEMKVDEHDKGL